MNVTLRLIDENDLHTLHQWLNREHLFPFYMQEPISIEAVFDKFKPRVGGKQKTKCLFASLDGKPFGYAQWYMNRSYPDYGASTIGREQGFSIDYFIGETSFLGKSLGSLMLKQLIEQIFPILEAKDKVAFIGHDNRNERAIRCTKRAGFVKDKVFTENGKDCTLFSSRVQRSEV